MVAPALIRPFAPLARHDFSASPLLVFYELTQACDLACRHCRACAQPLADPRELSPPESLRLMDQIAEFPEPPMLVLTGGDPLKRSDLFDLIAHGVAAGLEVSITPSATPLATRAAIERMQAAGISRMAVSIDGADAATHDAFRGMAGSFERSLQMLRDARELGLPTQVNTTLTPGNCEQLERLADLLAELGIVLWSVFFLVPVGRAREQPRLTGDECEAAFARLWVQSQRQPYAIKTTEAPHYRRFLLQQRSRLAHRPADSPRGRMPPLGINDGRGVMFVSHRGLVSPSGFLPIVCGVFPRNHLVDVYQRSPVMRALRDVSLLEGKCGECRYRRICGGSRARSFAVTGRLLAPEPDCAYVPANDSTPQGGHDAAPLAVAARRRDG